MLWRVFQLAAEERILFSTVVCNRLYNNFRMIEQSRRPVRMVRVLLHTGTQLLHSPTQNPARIP
jgi:hypothetical protein